MAGKQRNQITPAGKGPLNFRCLSNLVATLILKSQLRDDLTVRMIQAVESIISYRAQRGTQRSAL